jgi:hypothetical protein
VFWRKKSLAAKARLAVNYEVARNRTMVAKAMEKQAEDLNLEFGLRYKISEPRFIMMYWSSSNKLI